MCRYAVKYGGIFIFLRQKQSIYILVSYYYILKDRLG